MAVTILHNPKCSTSRHVLELLKERGADVDVIEYLENPPTQSRLKLVLQRMGAEPEDILRTRNAPEEAMKAWNVAETRSEKIKALSEHPILIERPIVVAGDKAALVRPKAEAAAILEKLGA